MTTDDLRGRIGRALAKLGRLENSNWRGYLDLLDRIGNQVRRWGGRLDSEDARAQREAARAKLVAGYETIDAEREKFEVATAAAIHDAVRAVGPVTEANRLLYEQLRTGFRADLTPAFAASAPSAIQREWERVRDEADELAAWAFRVTCATLTEQHPDVLRNAGAGIDREVLAFEPEALVEARATVREQQAVVHAEFWKPVESLKLHRSLRENVAERLLPTEAGRLVKAFESGVASTPAEIGLSVG